MSSSLSLPLNPSLHLRRHSPSYPSLCVFCSPKLSLRTLFFKSLVSYSSLSDYDREEARWLREEQRWLREEQRWLREENKWSAERDSLLLEIEALKVRIRALERGNTLEGLTTSQSEVIANISGLLNSLKEKSIIVETSSSATPLILEGKSNREEIVREVVVKEVVGLADKLKAEDKVKKERKTLRKGSEGAEVRAMQEALLKLGFFSGEEDMEFSSFSSGTERAVKTWQASHRFGSETLKQEETSLLNRMRNKRHCTKFGACQLLHLVIAWFSWQATFGATEDGIMTADLLERLNMDKINENVVEGVNGTAVTCITGISESEKRIVKENDGGVEVSQHRVFLLGENRWEDPYRKAGKGKANDPTNKCLSCRGEGRALCTECDGTGEPNVEPQFLEWVEEGAKCPYCEGLGYTICDDCQGQAKH